MTYAQPQIPTQRPLVPEDIPRGESLWRRSFVRAATARLLGTVQLTGDEIVQRSWPDDRVAAMLTRSATPPMLAADIPGISVIRLVSLAARSGAEQLANLATRIDLTGIARCSFPLVSSFTAAQFVGEADPIGVGVGSFDTMLLGPIKKIGLIAVLSNTLQDASADLASAIIGQALKVTVGKGLDAVLFSNAAATGSSPAGLLNGVSALTATSGGGFNAMQADLRNLIAAIETAGIDTSSVALIMSASQATPLGLVAIPGMQAIPKIITAPYLAAGVVIAVATSGLVIAGDGVPVVERSNAAVLHMSNSPSQIGTVGSPAVVAAPTFSMYQADSFALRCIANVTWAAAPGAVQYLTSATW